jgi:hypothetical protein
MKPSRLLRNDKGESRRGEISVEIKQRMPGHKEHMSFSAADIQRYVQGKMSAREMHAIEKAALDDPFLADAIEGFQQSLQEHREPVINGQLQALRKELQDRSSSKSKTRVIAFRWWQAAAAALIIIAGAMWIYNFSSTRKSPLTVAQKEKAGAEEQPTSTQTQAPAATDQQATAPAPAADSVMVTEAAPKQTSTAAISKKPSKNDVANRQMAPAAAMDEAVEKKDTSTPVFEHLGVVSENAKQAEEKDALRSKEESLNKALATRRNEVVKNEPPASVAKRTDDFKNRETELITIGRNDSQAKPVAYNDKNLAGFVKGRVTDPFNNPVANAFVRTPNTNNNILTDKTGYFKVPASDSVVDVSVNVVGYGTQNFRLQNNASLNELQLQPANAVLNEVEVKAISSKGKRSKFQTSYPTVMVQDAEPVYGWMSYEQYLENNKKLPAGLPSLKGNVVVSFVVHKRGELSDFKIERSLAKSYDDEAIRLISQGPAWKLLKGRKARITVIVRF